MKRKLVEYQGIMYTSQKHPLYKAWWEMIEKCRNPKKSGYPRFGGRGIKVCPEWSTDENAFINFATFMGVRPSTRHGVGRKDYAKDFTPENTYWEPRNLNQDRVSFVEYKGETIPKTKHPLYGTWLEMKRRCYDKKSVGYKHYGGRGIIVCDRWLNEINGFINFTNDMGNKPESSNRFTLDRKDSNGNYDPNNCRWADGRTQGINKRIKPVTGENDIRTVTYNNGKFFHYYYRRKLRNGRTIRSPHYRYIQEAITFRDEMNYRIDNDLPFEDMLEHTIKKVPQSDIPGVRYSRKGKSWLAIKKVNKIKYYLGTFDCKEKAEAVVLEFERRIKEGLPFDDLVIKQKNNQFKSKYQGVIYDKRRNMWIGVINILGKNYTTKAVNTEEEANELRNELKLKYNFNVLKDVKEIDFDTKNNCYKVTAIKLIPFTPIHIGCYLTKELAENALKYIYSEKYKQMFYDEIPAYSLIELRNIRNSAIIFEKVQGTEYYREVKK